jgi:MFS family permease
MAACGDTMAGFFMISGCAGDTFGHRSVFLLGVALLGASSLAAGLSHSLGLLMAARLAQSVRAAMSSVAALAIFVGLFPQQRERNRYFGIFMAATGIGFALGNALGGVMTSFLGWRSVLFVHAPTALAIIIPGVRLLRRDEAAKSSLKLDLAGGIISVRSRLLSSRLHLRGKAGAYAA